MNRRALKIVDGIASPFITSLADVDDSVSTAIAETNAIGFGEDGYDITTAYFSDQEIKFALRGKLRGSQSTEKPYAGNVIEVRLRGTAGNVGSGWFVREYEILECKLDFEDML